MPEIRKLSTEEVRTLENKGKGSRKITELEYDDYLAAFAPGDYGEAALGGDEKRMTVRNRFKAAARRRGIALQFLRTTPDLLRFRLAEPGAVVARPKTAKPVPAAPPALATAAEPPPASKRGGRTRKPAAEVDVPKRTRGGRAKQSA